MHATTTTLLLALATAACGGNVTDPSDDALDVTTTTSAIHVRAGATVDVAVSVARLGGVEGEVSVALVGLPAGMTAEAITLGPDQRDGTIQIAADASATHGGFDVRIEAIALDDDIRDSAALRAYIAGAPGTADASHGTQGLLTHDITPGFDHTMDAFLDGRGGLVVAGTAEHADNFAGWVARFADDGAIDPAFGQGGTIIGFGDGNSEARRVLRDGDGFLAVMRFHGEGSTVVAIRRHAADGAHDASYADGGEVLVPMVAPESDFIRRGDGVVIQDSLQAYAYDRDGAPLVFPLAPKVAIWSSAADATGRVVFGAVETYGLVRTTPTGELDETFGVGGYASLPMPAGHEVPVIEDVALLPDGGGYAGGTTETQLVDVTQAAVMRFDVYGQPVAGFGNNGRVVVDSDGYVADLELQADGGVLVLVYREPNMAASSWVVRRYLADGTLDNAFGTGGTYVLPPGEYRRMLVDPDARRAVVVGDSAAGELRALRLWL